MPGYRFCRPDDIPLIVRAVNECCLPHCPEEEQWSVARYKQGMREIGLWPSSCMLVFGGDSVTPIGVLLGCKRAYGTRIYRIGIHPDHLRQGHAGHMLSSLSGKLAVLGPPLLLAEVSEGAVEMQALLTSLGYTVSAELRDYLLVQEVAGVTSSCIGPVSVKEAIAAALLKSEPGLAWEQDAETLERREIGGLGFASIDALEACLFYRVNAETGEVEILRFCVRDQESREMFFSVLLGGLRSLEGGTMILSEAQERVLPASLLNGLGFTEVRKHLVYTMQAKAH